MIRNENSVRKSKHSLKNLTAKLLGEDIQKETHDSTQDALATMRLALLKFAFGPELQVEEEVSMSMFEILHRQQKRSAMIDRPQNIKGFPSPTTDVSLSSSDGRAIESAIQHLKGSPYFIWCQLHALSDIVSTLSLKDVSQPTPALELFATEPASNSNSIPAATVLMDTMRRLDQQIQTLYAALPSRSLLMIISNQDEEKKETFQRFLNPSSQNWTILHQNALLDFINQKRQTRSYFQIKP